MLQPDFEAFSKAICAAAEMYGKELSTGVQMLWWQALERYDFEQVSKALWVHVRSPENGQFMPKPGDLIRHIEGSATDRSALAWGKVCEAMSTVGSYRDVVFDDSTIHAVIEDLGGWPKLCRTELAELGYLQHRFTESYRAYAKSGDFQFPRILAGAHGPDNAAMYAKRGLAAPRPAVVGDVEKARTVWLGGQKSGKTAITFTGLGDVLPSAQKALRIANANANAEAAHA